MSIGKLVGGILLSLGVLSAVGSFYDILSSYLFPVMKYGSLSDLLLFAPWITVGCLLLAQSTQLLGASSKGGSIPASLNIAFVISYIFGLLFRRDYAVSVIIVIIISLLLVLYFSQRNPEKIWKTSLWLGIAFIILYIPLLIGSSNLVP